MEHLPIRRTWIATTTKVSIPSPYPGDDDTLDLTVEYDEEGRLEGVEFSFPRSRVDARYVKGLADFLQTIADAEIHPRPKWETEKERATA